MQEAIVPRCDAFNKKPRKLYRKRSERDNEDSSMDSSKVSCSASFFRQVSVLFDLEFDNLIEQQYERVASTSIGSTEAWGDGEISNEWKIRWCNGDICTWILFLGIWRERRPI